MIGLLMEKNAKLAKENVMLTEKNKHLVEVLDRRKAEITSLKRAAEAQAALAKENNPPVPPLTDTKGGIKITNPAKTKGPTNSSDQTELAQLKEENARLRNLDGSSGTPSSGFKGATRGKGDIESQLQDANRKLQTLQSSYDLMDIKVRSQALASKQSETQLESQNEKIRDLRKLLEELRVEKEKVDKKALRADELDDLVKELKRDNRSLEEKIAGLSREPFIKGVFEQQEARMEVSNHSPLNPNSTLTQLFSVSILL